MSDRLNEVLHHVRVPALAFLLVRLSKPRAEPQPARVARCSLRSACLSCLTGRTGGDYFFGPVLPCVTGRRTPMGVERTLLPVVSITAYAPNSPGPLSTLGSR